VSAAGRRLLAELVGTGLLVAVVAGSGIAASRLSADGALRLLVSAVVTALGLAVLILVFAPAGGAHFNPLVTAADWLLARRTPRRYGPALAAAVMGCQVAGAVGGAALADAMFAVPLLATSRHRRGGGPVLLGEVVATAGLLLLIVTLARTGRTQHAAWSVGAWIGAAYWFTSSTSFANPAVTIGRTLTPTYAGIAPASAPAFIAAEILGGGVGVLLAVAVHPARPGPARWPVPSLPGWPLPRGKDGRDG
jgi:glycerol uptake facilitator-like aquaporin